MHFIKASAALVPRVQPELDYPVGKTEPEIQFWLTGNRMALMNSGSKI
jgi:hypothetical protein